MTNSRKIAHKRLWRDAPLALRDFGQGSKHNGMHLVSNSRMVKEIHYVPTDPSNNLGNLAVLLLLP